MERWWIPPLGTWAALLVLTAALAALSRLGPAPALLGLLLLTPTKAWLVLRHFMHLKGEGLLLRVVPAVALGTLLIYLSLLFSDVAFR
ncbi:MAG TPA: cytochrome C oxidase subunit IV family protein [Holophaga sp.]|nr:cytochrome C oxidase subunit IV family protein [Holophaga sp.]